MNADGAKHITLNAIKIKDEKINELINVTVEKAARDGLFTVNIFPASKISVHDISKVAKDKGFTTSINTPREQRDVGSVKLTWH